MDKNIYSQDTDILQSAIERNLGIKEAAKELDKKIEYGEDETAKPAGDISYIINPNYDLESAFDFSSLSQAEATEIATSIYNEYKANEESSKEQASAGQLIMDKINSWLSTAEGMVNGWVEGVVSLTGEIANHLDTLSSYIKGGSNLGSLIGGIADIFTLNLRKYEDGVSETTFGTAQEASWALSSKSFLKHFQEVNKSVADESDRQVNILKSTPLDPGEDREALYGTMILGTPYLYNSFADPFNRTLTNTIVKDSRYLSLTPGMPKFHGLSEYTKERQAAQTANDGYEMLNYLLKNGLDSRFSDKDKRYYTFSNDYAAYFSYLETMLNAIWVKLGLAKNGSGFNIFTFFNIKSSKDSGNIDPNGYKDLLEKYNHSLGFYLGASGASVAESVSNSAGSTGSELASKVNSNSDTYQRLNYLTGMGTGGAIRDASRIVGNTIAFGSQLKSFMGETFQNTGSTLSSLKGNLSNPLKVLGGLVKLPISISRDIMQLTTSEDFGAILQSFAVSNGMRVVYPELWGDSSYSRSLSFEFQFTSPYGDPLSIFKYVYVPFCALACFAFPRQAAENGFVSPFFVRADVPGLFTCDLGMITDISWTKGGANNLWTKDGLPRSISVSITLQDLYPYLAMSRRLSFLSANPSYTVFLDNMAGLSLKQEDNSYNDLNNYFKVLIDRVNGETDNGNNLWNKYNSYKSNENKRISQSVRESLTGNLNAYSVPWMHNSSL